MLRFIRGAGFSIDQSGHLFHGQPVKSWKNSLTWHRSHITPLSTITRLSPGLQARHLIPFFHSPLRHLILRLTPSSHLLVKFRGPCFQYQSNPHQTWDSASWLSYFKAESSIGAYWHGYSNSPLLPLVSLLTHSIWWLTHWYRYSKPCYPPSTNMITLNYCAAR